MEFTISKGKSRAVCSSRGGELVSFTSGGTEYVWYGKAEHWSGQAPCLFPIVCRAKEDRVIFGEKSYPMKKHGIARKVEYTPVEVCPDKVILRLTQTEDSLESYPFRFNLDIIHTVTETGFSTEYRITNNDTTEMPFCIGGHPGFNCPMHDGESFEDYSLVFDNAEGAVANITEQEGGYMDPSMKPLNIIKNSKIDLKYSDFDDDAIIVENLPVNKLNLVNRTTGHGIRFEFDRFDAIGFWTPIKMSSPFICLEPWNGLPASLSETPKFTDKKYHRILAPGESYTTGYKVTII